MVAGGSSEVGPLDAVWAAQGRGEWGLAAVLGLDAARQYRRAGMEDGWFVAMVEAGLSRVLAGDVVGGYRLLFEARSQEPVNRPEWFAANCRVWLYFCALELALGLDKVTERLRDLEVFAASSPALSKADVWFLRSELAWCRGEYGECVELAERAWSTHVGGGRFSLGHIARQAGIGSVRCGDVGAALRWADKTDEHAIDQQGATHAQRIRLGAGLVAGLSWVELAGLLGELETRWGSGDRDLNLFELRVWVELLDPSGGDPVAVSHRASQTLRATKRPISGQDHRFRFVLLLVDCRLAGVRYAAGYAPVNDTFQDDVLAWVRDPLPDAEIQCRADRASMSLQLATTIAERLDIAWQTNHHTSQIEQRERRLERLTSGIKSCDRS